LMVEYQPFIEREFNPAFVMMRYIGYLCAATLAIR
jgi:hypothetical protein